jgi:multidrug efflux pump subunit AcrA (membrane-fusion protein)
VSSVADASSGVATFPVTVSFDADPTEYFVGGTVSGAITTSQLDNVLSVPLRAVSAQSGTSTVTLSLDGTTSDTRTQTVTTGITSAGMVQITSGLAAGDRVVVTAPAAFTRGTGTNRTGSTGTNGFFGGGEGGPPGAFTGGGVRTRGGA